jgi:hypothetical protein
MMRLLLPHSSLLNPNYCSGLWSTQFSISSGLFGVSMIEDIKRRDDTLLPAVMMMMRYNSTISGTQRALEPGTTGGEVFA